MNAEPYSPKPGSRAGFTLLELMVAVAILGLVLIMAFGSMMSVTDAGALESARNELDRAGSICLERVCNELRPASIIATAADGTSLFFQVPVDLDGNGSILNSSGDVEFGIDEGAGPGAGVLAFGFVQNRIAGGPGEVLNEATMNRDLNNDGDTLDVFDRGRIQRVVRFADGTTTARDISSFWVVQPSGNWGGDINGDGTPDPLFTVNNKRILIDIWMLGADQAGNTHTVRCTTSVRLRN